MKQYLSIRRVSLRRVSAHDRELLKLAHPHDVPAVGLPLLSKHLFPLPDGGKEPAVKALYLCRIRDPEHRIPRVRSNRELLNVALITQLQGAG